MKFLLRFWYVFFPLCLFIVLLLRNPFSDRNLIANLEPYPDSIHYISPALGMLRGQGLYVNREGRKLLPGVPPLYSLMLIPGYTLNQDVRMFYFTNVFLALVAFGFFALIVLRLVSNKFYACLLLLLYASNYTLYWFPELAMAENMILPVVLVSLYFLIAPLHRRSAAIVAALSVSFYAIKFASLPLSIAVPLLYFLRIVGTKTREKRAILLGFFLSLFVCGVSYVAYEFLVRGTNIVGNLLGLAWAIFAPKHVMNAMQGGPQNGGFFSLQYVGRNVRAYGHWVLGDPMYVLWKNLTILPKFLSVVSLIGLGTSLFTKRRAFGLSLLTILAFNLFFMMTFYAADGRYFISAIPILLLGIALAFSVVKEKLHGRVRQCTNLLLIGAILFYGISSLSRLKFDVMLNLKHAETPWYHISITTFDRYIKDHAFEYQRVPVVISALPPYVVDFYKTGNFITVPLSANQEFRTHQWEAWGDHNYVDLPREYAADFAAGHPVFLTRYGLGNEQYLHDAFNQLLRTYTFKKVVEGCFTQCDVYQMTSLTPSNHE